MRSQQFKKKSYFYYRFYSNLQGQWRGVVFFFQDGSILYYSPTNSGGLSSLLPFLDTFWVADITRALALGLSDTLSCLPVQTKGA